MHVDDLTMAEATILDGEQGSAARARALTTLAILAHDRPALIRPPAVAACGRLLCTAGLPPEVYEGALGALAAVVYSRPDLLDDEVVSSLVALFSGPPLLPPIYRAAGRVLSFLLGTPVAPRACAALVDLLLQPDHAPAIYDILLQSLQYAASWALPLLDLETVVSLAEQVHISSHRDVLLRWVIERCLFATPEAVTGALLSRLIALHGQDPSFKYCLYYLSGHGAVPDATRGLAEQALHGRFPLHETVIPHLTDDRRRLLVIQNIADGQGDEIVRVVPLLQAFLDASPRLDVVLVTARAYLYAHPRLRPVPIDARDAIQSLLQEPCDGVIDFFDPDVPEVNHDIDLEQQVQAYLATRRPFLSLHAKKGFNHFVYQRVDVASRSCAEERGLDRQRVANIYETTFRLIAELGLPLRLGEDVPRSESVLAGIPSREADMAWATLVAENGQQRPVALVNPFGGIESLKGYGTRTLSNLAGQVRDLIAEGFYVILLPNGTPWGTTALAREALGLLQPAEQTQVMIGPDPAEGSGHVTYASPHTLTVPYAGYMMHLVLYYMRCADLIVAVEGWMIHAAYCLGRRYRILMLPYSHSFAWHPYAGTRSQDVIQSWARASHAPPVEDASAPPLPAQPRKAVLLFLLGAPALTRDTRAIPLLRRALASDDREVRLAAAESLGRYNDPVLDADLLALLTDPAAAVRAAAAGALLAWSATAPARLRGMPRQHLEAHQLIGTLPRDWTPVLRLGDGAREALRIALRDDDPVIRREAALVLRILDDRVAASVEVPARDVGAPARQTKPDSATPGSRLRRTVQRLQPGRREGTRGDTVLILTPVKDAADLIENYCRRLATLTYPRALISLGFLESDSTDTTFQILQRQTPALRARFRRVGIWKKDFGYRMPRGMHRGAPALQKQRRAALARSRNHLLFHALDDEAWVLWLDVDVIEYPPDLLEQLLATGRDIVQPHCVLEPGGPTFDRNGWRDRGRLHLDDLRHEGDLVELDAVGGTVLLVRADLHRDGLIYPPFLYGRASPRIRADNGFEGNGEIETEGLGIMAADMGYRCWGMPHLEVIHRRG
jgi:peptide chain release factor subunit 1